MKLRIRKFPWVDAIARDAFLAQSTHPLPDLPFLQNMRVSPALSVWTAPFDVALRGALAVESFPRGWRVFAFDDREAVAADLVARGDEVIATRVFSGPDVRGTLDALSVAEGFAEEKGDVEVRILDVPSLFFTGVWVLSDDPRCIEVREGMEPVDRPAWDLFGELARFAEARGAAHRRSLASPLLVPED